MDITVLAALFMAVVVFAQLLLKRATDKLKTTREQGVFIQYSCVLVLAVAYAIFAHDFYWKMETLLVLVVGFFNDGANYSQYQTETRTFCSRTI